MKKSKAKTYQGMTYRQLQGSNKSQLSKDLDKLRKKHGLKNAGWDCVIELHDWLKSLKVKSFEAPDTFKAILADAAKMAEIESDIERILSKYPELEEPSKNNVIVFPSGAAQ